ncbi:hypothetical protein JTE90_016184 [Oedothorax gibbosus]|uniref:Peptidase M13 C-terminal domain-containing protein n=2 Tax=Oedothorax gibbosus TaxID=931172 RepID=A0AAV6TQ89_9ARAC|nr:hypothetical protein JTE90_016184 [Oedothorax gibbosus]
MFWIAYAMSWCRRQTTGSIEYLMENSVHSPAKFRVNGVLSNIKEFSEDFQCKLESPLNPKRKCFLWK